MRTVFVVVGTALMVVSAALAGGTRLAVGPTDPDHEPRIYNWALGMGALGLTMVCLALMNWSLYYPSNIHLPFVNER